MITVHTAQLNVGKAIPANSNVLFIDTTVRTGTDLVKENLAPTWDMVRAYKASTLSESDYTALYLDKLNHMSEACKQYLTTLSEGYGGITDIVLGCYCSAGTFCHRHILSRYLCKHFGFNAGYELTKAMIHVVEEPNGSVLSLFGGRKRTVDELKALLADEVSRGELRIVDEHTLGADFTRPATESAFDQALVGFINMSKLFETRASDPHRLATCVDVSYMTETMYDLDYIERGGDHLARHNTHTVAGGFIADHYIRQRGWHALRVPDDMSDRALRNLIHERGYTPKVIIKEQ